jgi:virginiamycin B lyase
LGSKRREKKSSSASSSRKIIGYALIGILAVAAVSVSFFAGSQAPNRVDNTTADNIKKFQAQFCGTGAEQLSTKYVSEISLPSECEMPLAIEAEGDRVWYVSTKHGLLGSYNIPEGRFEEEHEVPSWPARSNPIDSSMSWAAKADSDGNIWFTDERQKAIWRFKSSNTFDLFRVPADLPASIDFDSKGNIYFIGVRSQSIFIGDVSRMKNGTSEGMTEVPLPLEGFSNIDTDLVTTGSLAIDKSNNDIWVSLLAFQQKGQLFRYDINSGRFDKTVDLPSELSSPVGLAVDNSGKLWVTDHGTNIFFRYNPSDDQITKLVTSIASPKIYGGSTPPNAYTLPYWIEAGPDDSSLWFNQHTGNKLARVDPETLTLTEYWIPSQNRNWAACPDESRTCGLANALQLSVGSNGQVWFSEWTENKIGRVDATKTVPVAISIEQEEVTVARGDSTAIDVVIDSPEGFSGNMISSGTFTTTGQLGRSSGIFSEQAIALSKGGSKQLSYTFTADKDLATGEYVLMIGAEDSEVSVLKAVTVNIV